MSYDLCFLCVITNAFLTISNISQEVYFHKLRIKQYQLCNAEVDSHAFIVFHKYYFGIKVEKIQMANIIYLG